MAVRCRKEFTVHANAENHCVNGHVTLAPPISLSEMETRDWHNF